MASRIEEVTIQGMKAVYDSMVGHQLALIHGTTRAIGEELKHGKRTSIPSELYFRDRIGNGGWRSGKSRAGIYKVWNDSIFFPGNLILVVRKRHENLRNTFIREFREMAEQFTDGHPEWLILDEGDNGGSYEMDIWTASKASKIVFRIEPDGEPDVVQGYFKGYECGGIVFEEGSQLQPITYSTGLSRLSKIITVDGKKDSAPVARWKPFSLLLTNPAFDGHWVTTMCQGYESELSRGEHPLGVVVRSKMEDNPGLTADYIANEKKKYKDDPVGYDMYINGLDGIKIDGIPVFQKHFFRERHVKEIRYNPNKVMVRGLDWGFNYPACVWMQEDDQGHYVALAEFQGRQMEATEFARQVLEKSKQWFPLATKWRSWGDPSGFFHRDTGITATVVIRAGLPVFPAGPNNDAARRIGIAQRLLSRDVAGQARFCIHNRCSMLEIAFRHGYFFPVNSKGEIAEKPKKNNKYDNIMDACLYALEGETRAGGEEELAFHGGSSNGALEAPAPERLSIG